MKARGRAVVGYLCLVFVSLFLFGCGSEKFEGANIAFDYEPKDWTVSVQTKNTGIPIITAYTNDALFSVEAYGSNAPKADELFEDVRESDKTISTVGEATFKKASLGGAEINSCMYECTGSAKGGSTSGGDYTVWTQVKSFSDSRYVAAIAVYKTGDKNTYRQVRQMFSSLHTSSDKSIPGGISKTPENMSERGNTLDTYILLSHDSAYDKTMLDKETIVEASGADTKMYKIDGYEYLYKTQICDDDGYIIDVAVPEAPANQGNIVTNNKHGVSFCALAMQKYGNSLQEFIETLLSTQEKNHEADTREEINFTHDDPVFEDNSAYFICRSDHVYTNGSTYPVYDMCYVAEKDNGSVLFLRITINAHNYDGETNKLLEELSKEYKLPLTEYGPAMNELTVRGERVLEDSYVYSGVGSEITKRESCKYIGDTEIKDENDFGVGVFIPLGNGARNTGTFAIGSLLGVQVQANTANIAEDEQATAEDVAKEQIEYMYLTYSSNVRDYANVSKMKIKSMDDGARVIISFSADEIDDNKKTYKLHHLVMANTVKEKLFSVITMTFTHGDYSEKTNDLINELETAYSVDLNEFKNDIKYN